MWMLGNGGGVGGLGEDLSECTYLQDSNGGASIAYNHADDLLVAAWGFDPNGICTMDIVDSGGVIGRIFENWGSTASGYSQSGCPGAFILPAGIGLTTGIGGSGGKFVAFTRDAILADTVRYPTMGDSYALVTSAAALVSAGGGIWINSIVVDNGVGSQIQIYDGLVTNVFGDSDANKNPGASSGGYPFFLPAGWELRTENNDMDVFYQAA
ncbi:MAG: hypothetical protein ACPGO3_13300 [Magnetospiraceae bacterium]